MAWIYDKNGQQKCEVKKLSYNGVFMDVSSITVTVESAEPIAFGIGDYIDWDYDGLRYTLDTAAGVEKQARRNSIGNAFTYDNLVFLSPLSAAGNADFLDVVLGNTNDFLTNTQFSFYGTAWDYAKRLEANLCRLYGEGSWKIRIWTNGTCYDESPATGITTGSWENKLVDVSGIKCLGGFQQIYDLWGCAYVFSVDGGVNYVDFYDDFELYAKAWKAGGVDKIFAYGKGNGLYKIRHTADADHVLVTRLRAYGSSDNLPANYYLNSSDYHVDGNESSELAISHLMLPASQWTKGGVKSPANAYLEQNTELYGVREASVYWDGSDSELGEIKPTIYGLTIQDLLDLMASGTTYRPVESKWPDTAQRIDKIITGVSPTDNGAVAEAGYDFTVVEASGSTTAHDFGVTRINHDVEFNDLLMGVTPSVSHLAEFRIVPTSSNKKVASFDVPGEIASRVSAVTAYITPYVNGVKVEDATFPCAVSIETISNTVSGVLYTKRCNISLLDATENPIVFSTMLTGPVTFRIRTNVVFNAEMSSGFSVIRNEYAVSFNLLRGNKAIDKFFSVTIPQVGFDLAAAVSGAAKLCMRSGYNQPREFQIVPSSVRYISASDTWYLRCKRAVDQSTQTYFPNSDAVIAAGDEYYLAGIAMPSLYVEIAAQKLLAAATAWLDRHSKPRMLSSVDVDNKIMAVEGIVLKEGMSLPLSDADLDITPETQESRVIDNIRIEEGISSIRTFTITLRDKKEKSSLDAAIRGATSNFATNTSVSEAVSAVESRDHGSLSGRDMPNQHPITAITGLEEALAALTFFEKDGNGNVKLKDEYGGLWAEGFMTAGGVGSGGGGGGGLITDVYRIGDFGGTFGINDNDTFNAYAINSLYTSIQSLNTAVGLKIDRAVLWASLQNNDIVSTYNNYKIALAHIPDDDRLSYVDPESGENITIDDPGTTGTVLWGAESANQVALDVNGVSKTLVKMQALDGIRSSITTILGYFSGGAAYNALALEGHSSSYFATATGLNNLATTVAGLVTGVSSVAGKNGAVSLVIGDVSGLTEALAGKQAAGNYVNTIGGAYGVITLGTGLTMSGNQLSVTGQTQGTVTGVKRVGDTDPFTPDANGTVTIPAYPTALPNAYALTVGNKSYNGSEAVSIDKSDIGLGNVTNDAQVKRIEMGAASGVATLGSDGKIPSSQLPSYVDDVLEYASLSAFPATGESGKIYVALDTNKTYRWSGTTYVEISPSVVIGTTTGTAFDGGSGYSHVTNGDIHVTATQKTNWNTIYGYFSDGVLGLSHIPLDDRLSYVDPEAGEDITIDDPGTTGTVLWGAESANNVSLDVNGVSKTLVKQAAMDSVYSSISNLSALIGTKQDYISDLSSIRSNASLGATAYGWGDHRQAGYLTSVPTASALTLGIIRVGNGLSIDENGVVSVTGQTQGTVTRVYVGSTAYNPDTNGYVTLPLYAFGTDGNDYVPITIGSTTKNVLTAHQTLPTALKNPYKLTWGTNNEYDGSAAVTITASQLGALTSHQTVTLASGTNNGTLKITTAAGTTDNVAVTGLGTAAYRGVATTIGSSITNLVPGSLLYSVLGDSFDATNNVKEFINSSIATATATYRGSYNVVSDLGGHYNDSDSTIASEIATKMASLPITPDDNDYCFVEIPTSDEPGAPIAVTKRFKYNGTAWGYEYSLNNSGFTQAQWNALNSGITSTLVAAFNAKYDKPSGGIPKSDLASAVQTSLGLADTALQSHQTIYGLTIKNSAGTNVLSYTPNSAAGSLTLTKAMVGLGNVENFVYNVPTGAEQTYTYPV